MQYWFKYMGAKGCTTQSKPTKYNLTCEVLNITLFRAIIVFGGTYNHLQNIFTFKLNMRSIP